MGAVFAVERRLMSWELACAAPWIGLCLWYVFELIAGERGF